MFPIINAEVRRARIEELDGAILTIMVQNYECKYRLYQRHNMMSHIEANHKNKVPHHCNQCRQHQGQDIFDGE